MTRERRLDGAVREAMRLIRGDGPVTEDRADEAWRILRAALATESAPPEPGEGGPCRNCGVPWTATANDVAWDGPRDHLIGAAECPRCRFPALVKLDPPSGSSGEGES